MHDRESPRGAAAFARKHPVSAYFVLTYAISWTGALLIAVPMLVRYGTIPKVAGLLMFPVMLLGPSCAGIICTRILRGRTGLRDLFSQMHRVSVPLRWYAILLLPPGMVWIVLFCLKKFVSTGFTPNHFFAGLSFGLIAGFLEEIGWTGFAFPQLRRHKDALQAAIIVGLMWGAWHIPVIDYLGAATPHGSYWLPFLLAFTAAMTAIRVLIAWIYTNTASLLLAQLLHVSSTGALVAFSPPTVSPAQEVTWYAIYAAALWVVVGIIVAGVRWQSHDRREWL